MRLSRSVSKPRVPENPGTPAQPASPPYHQGVTTRERFAVTHQGL